MNASKYTHLTGWFLFAFALLVYALTAQQSVMFWDSGEFIASSLKVQATHPPGAPLYTLISRVFLLFFPNEYAALGASLFSGVCGALTVWFLFHTIIWLGNQLVHKIDPQKLDRHTAVLAAAVVGSLSLIFSDSFWVSSTEAEVYTVATVFMAAAFWAITKWEQEKGSYSVRWLLLIVFLLGLSMGVHVLNLALLFPLAALVSLRKYGLNIKGILIGLAAGLFLFIALNNILVQGFLQALAAIEINAVNNWNWGQHSGTFMGILIFALLLAVGIFWARKKKKRNLELIFVGIMLFTTGWSTYTIAIIRSDAETPTSNHTNNVVALLDYLKSNQYGFSNRPLLYGPSFMSVRDSKKEYLAADPILAYDEQEQKYVVINDGKKLRPNYMSESKMFFPRMWNKDFANVDGYKTWVNYEGKKVPITIQLNGKDQNLVVPTMGDNLAFFFKYQLGWLNFRYFMWNFVGRQNSTKGTGTPDAGNWVSGISLFDASRVGTVENIPSLYQKDKSNNEFYFLPLLLGIIGLIFLYRNGKAELWVTALFFLAFGVAITIFINQLPIHIKIRERDYIFLGAYYTFCMWIGIGVLGLISSISLKMKATQKSMVIGSICLLLVPALMGYKGWDDHDRSLDNEARIIAKNMLDQCDKNALLVTAGDNITFPLWYMQEVEEYRTDVRIIDYNLLGASWYSDRLRSQVNDSPPLRLRFSKNFYDKNTFTAYPLRKSAKLNSNVEIGELLSFIESNQKTPFIPSDLFKLEVDTSLFQQLNPNAFGANFVPEINWQLNKDYYSIQDLSMFDILSQNGFKRPVYFSNTSKGDFFMGLENYFLNKGMVNQLVPMALKAENSWTNWNELMDLEAMHDLATQRLTFDYYKDTTEFVHSLNANFARVIYLPLFYKLAYAYRVKEDMDKCIEILDMARQTFPNENMPYDQYMFKLAAAYYEAGDTNSWKEVSRIVMKNLMDELNWYTSFDPLHDKITYERVQKLVQLLNSIKTDIARLDKELSIELNPGMQHLHTQYTQWIASNPILQKLKTQRKAAQENNNYIKPNLDGL